MFLETENDGTENKDLRGPFQSLEEDAPTVDGKPQAPGQNRRLSHLSTIANSDPSKASTDPGAYLSGLIENRRLIEERADLLGTAELRREQAFKKRREKVTNFVDLAQNSSDPDLVEGAGIAAQLAATEDIDKSAETALEENAAAVIEQISFSNPSRAALFQDALDTPDTLDKVRLNTQKSLYLQSLKDASGAGDRKINRKAGDWLVDNLLFAFDSGTDHNKIDLDNNNSLSSIFGSFFLPGSSIRDNAQVIQDLTFDEFRELAPQLVEKVREVTTVAGVTNDGEFNKIIDELGLNVPTEVAANLMQGIEIASVLPVAKSTKILSTLTKAGAKSQASEVLSTATRLAKETDLETAAREIGLEAEEIVNESLPTALRLDEASDTVPVASEAEEALREGQELFENIVDANGRSKFTPTERSEVTIKETRKSRSSFGKDAVKNVEVEWTPNPDGSVTANNITTIGKVKGTGGYIHKSSAEKVLNKYALDGEVFQDASGEWFARAKLPVTEKGSYTTPLKTSSTTLATRFLGSSANTGDAGLHGAAIQGGRLVDKVLNAAETISFKTRGRLSGKQTKIFDEILEETRDSEEGWLQPQELIRRWEAKKGSPLTPKEADRAANAYSGEQSLMTLEFFITNLEAVKQKTARGFQNIELPGGIGEGNGKVIRTFNGDLDGRIHDVTSGTDYGEGLGDLTPELWEGLKKKGYQIIQFETPVELENGARVSSFIGRGEDFKVSSLRPVQIPYKSGVHRQYQGRYFAKAASRHVQPDSGQEILQSPKTYRNFVDKKQAQEWVDTINSALKVVKEDPTDLARLARIFDGQGEYPTPQQFVKSVEDGHFHPDSPLESLVDGTLPSDYKNNLKFVEETNIDSLQQLGRVNGRSPHSPRGDRLEGFDGKPAPTLSPSKTLNRTLTNAAQLSGFGDVVEETANRMVQSFAKYIDNSSADALASPRAIIKNARLLDDTPSTIKAQWETQKAILGRWTSAPTAWDEIVDSVHDRFEDIAGSKISNWAREADPVNGLKSFAFHSTLGLVNIGQFIVQVSTTLTASTLSPNYLKINPFQLFAGGVFLRFAQGYKGNIIGMLDKNPALVKALGFETAEEAVEMATALRNSGWMNVNNSHQLANTKTGGLIGRVGNGARFENAKKVSGAFFYEPERWNRSVAFTLAWRQAKLEAGGTLSRKSLDDMTKVYDYADTYSIQMTSESRAAFQRGPASVPTQFFAYPIRMMELVLSRKLTGNQKAKLLAGQVLLYGSAGTPITHAIANKVKDKEGQEFEKGTLGYVVDRGIIDVALNMGVFGSDDTDIVLGGRVAVGTFISDFISELNNTSAFGDTSVFQFVGGVSGQRAVDTYKDIDDLINYNYAKSGQLGDLENKRIVASLAKSISSVNNIYKGYVALKHQEAWSRKRTGGLIDDQVTTPEAFAAMLGLNSSSGEDISRMMQYIAEPKERIEETAKLIGRLRTEAIRDPDKALENNQQISILINILNNPKEAVETLEMANRFVQEQGLHQSIERSFQRVRAEKALSDRIKKHQEESGQ